MALCRYGARSLQLYPLLLLWSRLQMPKSNVQVIGGQFAGGVHPAAVQADSVRASALLSFTTVLQLKPHPRFDGTCI